MGRGKRATKRKGRPMKRALLLVLVLALGLLAAGCGSDDDEAGDATTEATTETGDGGAGGDCSGSIGIMAPITGDAGSIGTEQLNFAKFAVDRFNEENGTD